MPTTKTLQDAMLDEIRDAYNAEKQLVKALPRMAKAASSPKLKAAFQSHLAETEIQVKQLEAVFEMLGEKVRGKQCEGMAGIIEEAKGILEEEFDPETLDACLIAAGQRAEHYEMAAYGTLVAWAEALGNSGVAKKLGEILEQEKAADRKLSALAEGGINAAASTRFKEAEEPSRMAVKG